MSTSVLYLEIIFFADSRKVFRNGDIDDRTNSKSNVHRLKVSSSDGQSASFSIKPDTGFSGVRAARPLRAKR